MIYKFADTQALSEEELSLLLHSNPNTVAKIMEYVNQHPEANNAWLDNQLHRLRVMFHCPSLTINGSLPGSIRPTSGASFRAQVPPTPTTSHLGATDQRTYKRYESCSASDRHTYWHGKCIKILRHYEHGLLLQISELVEQLQPFANRKWGEPTVKSILDILQADNKRFDVSFLKHTGTPMVKALPSTNWQGPNPWASTSSAETSSTWQETWHGGWQPPKWGYPAWG